MREFLESMYQILRQWHEGLITEDEAIKGVLAQAYMMMITLAGKYYQS